MPRVFLTRHARGALFSDFQKCPTGPRTVSRVRSHFQIAWFYADFVGYSLLVNTLRVTRREHFLSTFLRRASLHLRTNRFQFFTNFRQLPACFVTT